MVKQDLKSLISEEIDLFLSRVIARSSKATVNLAHLSEQQQPPPGQDMLDQAAGDAASMQQPSDITGDSPASDDKEESPDEDSPDMSPEERAKELATKSDVDIRKELIADLQGPKRGSAKALIDYVAASDDQPPNLVRGVKETEQVAYTGRSSTTGTTKSTPVSPQLKEALKTYLTLSKANETK